MQLQSDMHSVELFGPADEYLRILRAALEVRISSRAGNITITAPKAKAEQTAEIIEKMQKRLATRGRLTETDINELVTQAKNKISPVSGDAIEVYSSKGVVEPFTEGQRYYIRTILKNDLTFCIGPAGTGKTYLAVAAAVSMLKKKQIRKIVLARPAVEAGEKLGFLPGDLQAKVNPYLRPLFDSLEDMMEFTQMRKFIEMDIIEVIPIAFMRGRTLNEAIIICDEAQNTLTTQMMMFLTRLGRGSKMIITGDITQIDLEKGQDSGMIDAGKRLKGISGIGFVELKDADIVRHRLVQDIVQAYSKRGGSSK